MTATLYIQPGAKKTELAGEYNGYRKLRVKALPIDNAANEAAICFIAQALDAPKSAISLIKGEKGRLKTFFIDERYAKNPQAIANFS
ncbi:MAG: DUF167 domain-containing protein [Deferribacteraceae bacterium]|jgi:uncharacterized protein YggU (UPF0235/DUF167 family)|nr:DUF167 domain-containing protein [Deferribacteraceae bacterium]